MPQLQPSSVRVLYIEDDPTATALVRTGLEASSEPGFDLEAVATLGEALSLLTERDFEVVLLDLGLPDSEGLATLTDLRAEWPDLPIVVLTARTYREVGIAALHNGADEFLEKENFNGKLLTRLLVFAIERRRLLLEVDQHQRYIETAEVERSRLVQAVSNVDDLVIITDPNGLVQYANPAFERITGYTTEEVLGSTPALLRSGETEDKIYAELWETLGAGQTWRGRFVNRRKDGSLYRQESVISPIRDHSGELSGYVGLGRDVTHEREMEAQLRQTQKLHALGQLASGVAHDFNNTLAVIMTVAGVLKQDVSLENEKVHRDIDEILQASRRAQGVVARLLGFSRNAALRLRPLSLPQLVTGMRGMLRATLPSTIALSIEIEEDLQNVLADENAVEQILLNLVNNARDAMPDGGEIQVTVGAVTVDEEFVESHPRARAGAHVCLSVTDTGVGIPTETLDEIFTPFFTTKPVGKGTGLGLAMVSGLMDQHSGAIHAYSEAGMGSVFKLYFPAVRERRRKARPALPVEELSAGNGEVVLLIEDDAALRRAGSRVLKRAGYEVRVAEDGLAGLEMHDAGPNEIDVIVSDLVMPRMGGKEVIAKLRERGIDTPVVLTSGYLDQVNSEKNDFLSRVIYLPKPWTIEDLLRGVRYALDWKRDADTA